MGGLFKRFAGFFGRNIYPIYIVENWQEIAIRKAYVIFVRRLVLPLGGLRGASS
jgi:hypothetical protein